MRLVVHANVLFSLLIREEMTAVLFALSSLELFVPSFLFEEVLEHVDEILEKTHRDKESFSETFQLILERVVVVPKKKLYLFFRKEMKFLLTLMILFTLR